MKKALGIILFITASCSVPDQNISIVEKKLDHSFQKIQYWHDAVSNKNPSAYDSLYAANRKFEKLLHYYTASNPESLRYNFKSLRKNGLFISSSEDGKFRIYSWDTQTGGTMRFYRNVFQYESNKKVYSEISESDMEQDPESMYYKINDLPSQNKKYYLVQNTTIYSNALSYHTLKVFSIENEKLNSNTQLIKTPAGIKNELDFELDFTASPNRIHPVSLKTFDNLKIQYNPKEKIISIPLILDDSKITDERVRYQFKGKYFEKI
ncbi:hypothetical protein F3J23_00775 [Chryseobacterium sp. Tr-659]|uniref:hypothetical protein n=1 Tax=Chryseobacterium sp. Tr-659 TaxID=2608340 RepID=UPI0014249EE1|nr:hypothetical protein [Chryseobacterium sp. Tr-659]NIF03958.1 hypothetical protein [Chryseobacterium sp. Tr-659]